MLQNKENNTELVNAKNRLENAVNDTDPTHGMTQETINYNAKSEKLKMKYKKRTRLLIMEMLPLKIFLLKNLK